ncbi:nibrin [Dunckerocampus dactyliophorus]|uniref:nibrin n=1 Tax=Dunckerocampus dactyliophorus TaxID=161453 RepID=UPI002405605E|nr:nibrin [Dunckerocampus dactyliophorus]
MWILIPVEPAGETHYLLSGKEYVVGRKNCEILLPNDQSISRAHAHFIATDQTLTLKDTSKYGTVVNSQRLTENTPVNVKSGDSVTFGVFHSKFSVAHQKLVVCSSCLDNDGKAALSQALQLLGGTLVNTWSKACTHLVMPSVKVTIKTISALLCCRPIVKPEFFSELSKATQQKLPPPKPERFTPDIDEPSLNEEDVNLQPDVKRKQLFAGTTFIFLSAKQLKRLSTAVSFGGGTSQLLEEGSLPCDLLESPKSCVVEVTTGSSQPVLPHSTTGWHDSVKSIVERKCLRVITESEIGLAAIYASCCKYCNPASLITDTVPKVKPRIPSASLSQHVAVDETVLPAASQNITAYAVNTETPQKTERCQMTGIKAVGETPEKKHNGTASHFDGSKATTQTITTKCIVTDSLSSSFSLTENTHTQGKKPESRVTGHRDFNQTTFQPPMAKPGVAKKTFTPKKSPQDVSPTASPQKQPTMTSFFKPVNKKRPLDEELSAVTSAPKRPVPESNINTTFVSEDTPSCSNKAPAASSQNPMCSDDDFFVGRSASSSERASHTSRKRKEMEEEIDVAELEFIMSEEMDSFDESLSVSQAPQARIHTVDRPSETVKASNKKQRVALEDDDASSQRLWLSLEKELPANQNHQTELQADSEITAKPSKERARSKVSSGSTRQLVEANKESSIKNIDPLKADVGQPKEAAEVQLVQPVKLEEAQETKLDEDHPKNLILVEFRSLTVNVLPESKPQQAHTNSFAKNFKRFRKMRVPGTEGSAHIIGGSDLLAHNRGKNSELDEWLKDAIEDERQSRREESQGDDLFRYNPTKLTRRR